MAKDKKGFVLYADLIHTVEKLPDDKAGELFKHILNYVNDNDPQTDDLIINISFEPIKQQLKRDLEKYESTCNRNKTNGLKGGRPKNPTEPKKPTGLNGIKKEPKKPDKDTDTDNDTVKDKVNVINKENTNGEKPPVYVFSFKNELLKLGVEKQIIEDWLKVRKLKKAKDTITSFQNIETQIKKSGLSANECIKIAVEKDWKGFNSDWIKTTNTNNSSNFIKRPNDSDY